MTRSANDSTDSPLPAPAWQLLTTESWLVFDAETTGRGERAEVVEVAVVDASGVVRFDALMRPRGPMSRGAERVHGLTEDRLADAPLFAEHYARLRELLSGRVVVAYYSPFDRRVLATSCALVGRPEIPANWLCALELFESLRGFRPPLHVACEVEGVEGPRKRHRALSDAVALRALVVRLREVAAERDVL